MKTVGKQTHINLDEMKSWAEFKPDRLFPITSYIDVGLEPDKRLFFYHMAKAGGTTTIAFLRSLAWSIGQTSNSFSGKYGKGLEPLPGGFNGKKTWCWGGHAIYPFHELFAKDASLMTVIRDPVSRAVSHFFWLNQSAKQADLNDPRFFEEFLKTEARCNHQTKALFGPFWTPNLSFDDIAAQLDSFKYVASTQGMKDLFVIIASANQAPSIVVNKGKVSGESEYKHELKSLFEDQIKTLNAQDQSLFELSLARDRKNHKIVEDFYNSGTAKVALVATPVSSNGDGFGKSSVFIDLASEMCFGIEHAMETPFPLGTHSATSYVKELVLNLGMEY